MNIPSGSILLWSGAIVAIPPGFILCDGNNGTPDLRNQFIIGAGDTYAVDDTGGNLTHTHTLTTDGHNHYLAAGTVVGSGTPFLDRTQSNTDTATTDASNHLPPYYALAYIMKT